MELDLYFLRYYVKAKFGILIQFFPDEFCLGNSVFSASVSWFPAPCARGVNTSLASSLFNNPAIAKEMTLPVACIY